jgi:3-oxoacyl-[acyl-carrier-protein] synthase III
MSSLKEGDTIDLIIYASVYGEVGEPASSNVIAHELGLDLTECVDMKAACDGAMKAFKHASALLAAGLYERIMVVNAEFSLRQDYAIWPKLFDLKSPDQLNYRFPAYTIGEAASAVIVEHNPATPWRFHNATRNNLFDLCTVAPAWYKKGSLRSPRVGMDGAGMFTSWAAELSANGIPLSVETFRQSGIKPDEVDILFTHASGTRDWTEITKQIDLFDKWYDIYPEYGNLVSASVPVAMALASAQGRLEREMRVAILVASAGMTFSTAHFTF